MIKIVKVLFFIAHEIDYEQELLTTLNQLPINIK